MYINMKTIIISTIIILLLINIGRSKLNPGDFAINFEITSKIDNKTYTFSQRNIKSNNGSNLIFLNVNASDYFIMNFFNSNKSVDEFLQNAMTGKNIKSKTTFMFYSKDTQLLKQIRDKIMARLQLLENKDTSLRNSLEVKDTIRNALFFADNGIPEYFTDILNTDGWNSKQRFIESTTTTTTTNNNNNAPSFIVSRLDGEYEWNVWPCSDSATGTSCASGVLISSGKTCHVPAKNISKNKFVLVHLSNNCDVIDKIIQQGMKNGVQGIVFVQELGKDVIELNQENTNMSGASIILTMISYFDGKEIASAMIPSASVNISFTEPRSNPGKYFGIDSFGKLTMIGWEKFPFLMTLGWSSWKLNNDYDEYLKSLETPTFTISLFDHAPSGGSWSANSGAIKNITLPTFPSSLNVLEIEFALSCIDTYDFNCGIWDRVISLNICIHDDDNDDEDNNMYCNLEIARYITAFRRGEGKWITDITHLFPIFYAAQGKQCTISIAGTPEIWYITSSLRLSHKNVVLHYDKEKEHGIDDVVRATSDTLLSTFTPIQTIPLYNGQYTFDKEYNNRSSIDFIIPSSLLQIDEEDADNFKILLSSVITGHGSDENGCGEFCSTTHHFYFNDASGNTYEMIENFSLPTTHPNYGCANHGYLNGIAMTNGVNSGGDVALPNEHGTWTLGRNGWCNGQRVAPYKELLPGKFNSKGNKITVTYKGFYNGKTPNPKQSPGYMIISSYITIYEKVTTTKYNNNDEIYKKQRDNDF